MREQRREVEKRSDSTVRDERPGRAAWRSRLYVVIFEHDTRAGKAFDVALLWLIVVSVIVVLVDSLPTTNAWRGTFRTLEWGFTTLFLIEYLLRLLSARDPWRYATSFFGIIDLLAILPTLVSPFIPSGRYLLVVRLLRVIRIFRVLKLVHFLREADVLARALAASVRKIGVFLLFVALLVTIIGSLMYAIEGAASGFTSIPTGIYWAIVTITTVGYGDISPQTALGRLFASVVMLTGYAIIAVPTGIVTLELAHASGRDQHSACSGCGLGLHDRDARFCKRCGVALDIASHPAAHTAPDSAPSARPNAATARDARSSPGS